MSDGRAKQTSRARNNRGANAHIVSVARRAAAEILRRVEEEGAFASVLLAASDEAMRSDDRALCYELVLGVLRWQQWLDSLIEYYAQRPAQDLDGPVRRALRLGFYQLRFLQRIPVSAVVNESVNLAHRARLRSAANFINAVLRRATREPDYDPAASITDPVARLAVETSHPVWLIARWARAFGVDETRAFAYANNHAPPVAFRLNARGEQASRVIEELRAAGAELSPSKVTQGAWRICGGGGRVRELARTGLIYIQDEASQLVAHALDAHAGERVLDVCAAPGSKTTHIAALAEDAALVVAGDIHEHRLRTVAEASARAGAQSIRVLAHDATKELPFMAGAFDRVLVDAPCTGTGTLRRNPEIRWRISTSDLAELSARQQLILSNAAAVVRPAGGRIVYSTCSVEPEENEEVVAAFLEKNASFKHISPSALKPYEIASGAARTWPQRDGTDGFFIAAFERAT